MSNRFDPSEDICECAHTRQVHATEGDFDGERFTGYMRECEYRNCDCEQFLESEIPTECDHGTPLDVDCDKCVEARKWVLA